MKMKLIMETFKRKIKEEWEEEKSNWDDWDEESEEEPANNQEELERRNVPEVIRGHEDFRFSLKGEKGDSVKDKEYLGNLGYDAAVFRDQDGSLTLSWLEVRRNGKEVPKKKAFSNPEELVQFFEKAIAWRSKFY
jgi:hypothetical protein